MNSVILEAQTRSVFGRKVNGLRRAHITPIHVYGLGADSLSLQTDAHQLLRTLATVGRTTPLTVAADGDEHFVMVREVQRHPVTSQVLHVDLLRVSRTQKMRADVPLQIEGEAPGARLDGAMLLQDLHEVTVEALPTDLPHVLAVDISTLAKIGSSVRVGALVLPRDVTLVSDPEAVIMRIALQRALVEEEGALAEEGLAEGEVSAEEGAPAEPEVITAAGESQESQ